MTDFEKNQFPTGRHLALLRSLVEASEHPLFAAVRTGNLQGVKELLSHGAPVNIVGSGLVVRLFEFLRGRFAMCCIAAQFSREAELTYDTQSADSGGAARTRRDCRAVAGSEG